MAKKKSAYGQKSAAVRTLLNEHGKKAKSKTIIAAAAELGYHVHPSEVSRLRREVFGRRRRRKATAVESNGAAPKQKRQAESVSVETLLAVRDFARRVGGRKVIEYAFEVLDLLRG